MLSPQAAFPFAGNSYEQAGCAYPPEALALSGAVEKAMEASQGSTTNSVTSTVEIEEELLQEQARQPGAVEIKRLMKLKAEQEQKLKMLKVRVERLTTQERRVWKDVTWTQQMSLQAQEAQWRRQAQQADRRKIEKEQGLREQVLKERARRMREQEASSKDTPRLQRFEDNKAKAEKARQDSKRLMAALQDVRQQTLENKQMQVECQRQQRRQSQLRKELEQARREQARQDLNMMKFAELQEEMQSMEAALAAAESEELSAVSRLQNSQTIRAEAVSQLQATRGSGASSSSEAIGGPACGPCSPEEQGEATSPPRTGSEGSLGMLGGRSGSRSSPRLLGGSPPHSPQQGSPPPACPSRQQPTKLGGSRSTGSLGTRVVRPGLGQITEGAEEDTSTSPSPRRSPVELAVEEFRKQVASFQAQSHHFQNSAQATTQRLETALHGSPTGPAPRKPSPRSPASPSAAAQAPAPLPHAPGGIPGPGGHALDGLAGFLPSFS